MGSYSRLDHKKENLLKRQAIQVAGMLPDDPNEALLVLHYAREIIQNTFGVSFDGLTVEQQQEAAGTFSLMPQRQTREGADGVG